MAPAVRVAALPLCSGVTPAPLRCSSGRAVSSRMPRPPAATGAPSDVFVLDFDGVLVDSEPEVSASAIAAAAARWPEIVGPVERDEARRAALFEGLRTVRPVLVRGYESMVQARLLAQDPSCAPQLLNDWQAVLQDALTEWNEDWQQLQALFEARRAAWLSDDRVGWLALNAPFPGAVDALASCPYPVYFASSKAAHRVSVLLQHHFGLDDVTPESPRLFASLLPPEQRKVEALLAISGRPVCSAPDVRRHFVDDRLDTLLAIRAEPQLSSWLCYLATWGYCTDEERSRAATTPGIVLLQRPQFFELMKWGVLMGVDDGCEPTPQEVVEGVHRPISPE